MILLFSKLQIKNMTSVDDIYNKLYNSTYYINARSKQKYLLFFAGLIKKYLDDITMNYYIYVSITNDLLPLYQESFPSSTRIIYVFDTLIPTIVPDNVNSIYIFHKPETPTVNEQLDLASYVLSHTNMKYILVGPINKLLTSTRIRLFQYYLYFDDKNNFSTRDLFVASKYYYQMTKKYNTQKRKKRTARSSYYVHDYFIFHNNITEESEMIQYNEQLIIPKKKKKSTIKSKTYLAPKLNKPSKSINNNNNNIKPIIKYIYTNTPIDSSCLIMPDGSKENYKSIIDKYQDVIEI